MYGPWIHVGCSVFSSFTKKIIVIAISINFNQVLLQRSEKIFLGESKQPSFKLRCCSHHSEELGGD